MSSSLGSSNNSTSKGSGGGGGSASAAALTSENPTPPPPEGSMEKCGGGTRMVDDWEGQDQSILRLIMGDVEDPSAGLTKLLQTGS
ncbi:hypothetical protein PIB30_115385, partial [Stylosanthes scabra]|nr:hypothetical protein [Stylosanthes scabra]